MLALINTFKSLLCKLQIHVHMNVEISGRDRKIQLPDGYTLVRL